MIAAYVYTVKIHSIFLYWPQEANSCRDYSRSPKQRGIELIGFPPMGNNSRAQSIERENWTKSRLSPLVKVSGSPTVRKHLADPLKAHPAQLSPLGVPSVWNVRSIVCCTPKLITCNATRSVCTLLPSPAN